MSNPDFWLAVGIMGRVHYGSTDKQKVVDHIATLSLYNDIKLMLVPVRRFDEYHEAYVNAGMKPTPIAPYLAKSCTKCGLDLTKVMSYCCSHLDCPTGMGPVS